MGSLLAAPATPQIRFALATDKDDPEIRRLLRENEMRGEVALSLEHEPHYFHHPKIASAEDKTVLAFEKNRLVGLNRCSIHNRYLNGEIRRVGYFTNARLDASHKGRFDIIRRSFKLLHAELHCSEPPFYYFCNFAADNHRAIRIAERHLPGMPLFEVMAHFVTLFIQVPRKEDLFSTRAQKQLKSEGLNCISGAQEHIPDMAACLNFYAKKHQLALHWTEEEFRSLKRFGLSPADFRVVWDGNKVIACAALWDQRTFKQIVVRGYGSESPFRFGPVGSTIAQATLSPLAVPADNDQLLLAIIESSLSDAAKRGLEFLTLSFTSDDFRLTTIRNHFRCHEYLSRLDHVRWHDTEAEALDGRSILPETAFL